MALNHYIANYLSRNCHFDIFLDTISRIFTDFTYVDVKVYHILSLFSFLLLIIMQPYGISLDEKKKKKLLNDATLWMIFWVEDESSKKSVHSFILNTIINHLANINALVFAKACKLVIDILCFKRIHFSGASNDKFSPRLIESPLPPRSFFHGVDY